MSRSGRSDIPGCMLLAVVIGTMLSLSGQACAQVRSVPIPMHDGVDLAADVILPDAPPAHRPTLLVMTRYGRRSRMSPGALKLFTGKGMAVALVDMRGSGASGGHVTVAFSKPEREDVAQVIDWIASQPWSDGRIVTTGTSYDANLAELAVASGRPAVKAAIPRFIDFDTYRDLALPGGVRNEMLLRGWSKLTETLDAGRPCVSDASACTVTEGMDPVDGDRDFARLRRALLDHQSNWRPYDDTRGYAFYDDVTPAGDVLASGFLSQQAALSRSATPVQLWGSWLDANTAESALEVFRRNPAAPIELFLGAWTHGGGSVVDPLRKPTPEDAAAAPQLAASVLHFVDGALGGAPDARSITYYVMGSGQWRKTTRWPPAGVSDQVWSLAPGGLLTTGSVTASANETYKVDFSATTGTTNRWTTQLGGGPVDYGDRAQADAKPKTFTSAPLADDMEITGAPTALLQLSSTDPDGAIFVYLEAVAPDGRVAYLSEGEQRLTLHPSANAGDDPGAGLRRRDFSPMTPGRTFAVRVSLKVLSARVPRGYRIRLAVAGADADTFARYPSSGEPVLTLGIGGAAGSRLILPEMVSTQ